MIFSFKKHHFLKEFQSLIKQMENKEVVTPMGDFYSKGTITNYKQMIYTYEAYENHLEKTIFLQDIDCEWCEKFRLWLLDKGYSKNTIAVKMSNLKAFLRRLHKAGKAPYDGSGVRTPSEITTAVFTSIAELKALLQLDLPMGIARVRDMYICQCFIGLRVTDTLKLLCNLPLHIKEVVGKRFLEIKTAKTGEVVVIPMATIVSQIAEKRNYDFGKPFSQQYYHETLRKIIALSNFDREVIFNRTEGGVMQERILMYSELIGTHTARRTFATNAYLSGLNPVDIMKITGHRSFNSFIRYIRCENTSVALKISNHEFFTQSL